MSSTVKKIMIIGVKQKLQSAFDKHCAKMKRRASDAKTETTISAGAVQQKITSTRQHRALGTSASATIASS